MMIGRSITQVFPHIGVVFGSVSWAQVSLPGAVPASSPARASLRTRWAVTTPRGTVLGFLNASPQRRL